MYKVLKNNRRFNCSYRTSRVVCLGGCQC